jgi:hypothetical protein
MEFSGLTQEPFHQIVWGFLKNLKAYDFKGNLSALNCTFL